MKRALFSILIATVLAGCASFTEPNGERLKAEMGVDVTPIELGTEETPDVSYSAEVILGQAEGYYQDKQFEDAAREYARFIDLHATHPWAPFALFREGMSYVHQVKSTDRDPALTLRARQAFENILANYPDSPAVGPATEQRDAALERLANGELKVAQFYIRTHRPEAALARLRYLLDTYPATATAERARYELGLALAATGDVKAAKGALRRFLESGNDQDPTAVKRAEQALSELESP